MAGGMVHVYVAMQRADDVMERPNVPGLPRTSSRNTCPRKRGHGTRHPAGVEREKKAGIVLDTGLNLPD